MHGEEGQVRADQHQPEMHLPEAFAKQLTSHFGEPVVEAREDTEGAAAKEDIVQVRDHEVAVGHLVVKGHHGQCRTIETTDQEHTDKAKGEEHWNLQIELAMPECC